MLCPYCGKSLNTVEGNVGTAHQCLASTPALPERLAPSPVSSLIQPRLPRLRLIPDSAERRALRGQAKKRRAKNSHAELEGNAPAAELTPLLIDGFVPPSVLTAHPGWQARAVLSLAPLEGRTPVAPPRDSRIDELYRKVRAGQGDTRGTLQTIGELLLESRRFDEAEPVFEELISLSPESPEAQAGAGVCLENQGRWGEAAARFRMALELNPDLASALAGLGHCLLRQDNPVLARNAFEKCLSLDPRQIPALVGRALCLQLMGKSQEASAAYADALRLRPEIESSLAGLMDGIAIDQRPHSPTPPPPDRPHLETIYNQGVAAFQNGDIDLAVQSFRTAGRLRPAHAESWQALGIALHDRDEEGAKLAYRTALDIAPQLTAARWNLALLQEKTGELVEAARTLSLLVEAEPENQEFWFRLAAVLVRTGDFEGAFAAARKCPGFVGSGHELYQNLGSLCWQRGDLTAAGRCFEELLKMQPESAVALRVLAAVAMRMQDYVRALDLHRHLYEAGDQGLDVLCNRAGLEMRAGRPIAALAYFRQAAELRPDCKEAVAGIELARRASLDAHQA